MHHGLIIATNQSTSNATVRNSHIILSSILTPAGERERERELTDSRKEIFEQAIDNLIQALKVDPDNAEFREELLRVSHAYKEEQSRYNSNPTGSQRVFNGDDFPISPIAVKDHDAQIILQDFEDDEVEGEGKEIDSQRGFLQSVSKN